MRKLVLLLLVGLSAGGGFYYFKYVREVPPPSFRTAPVERGDLLITISATGTVEPEDIVDVGAQVVGRIAELGMDPRSETDPKFKDKRIDFNSPVHEGTVLAKIDPALYIATRDQAQAGHDRAVADLLTLEAKYVQTQAEWNRAQKLRELKLTSISGLGTSGGAQQGTIKGISDADFVLAKANYEVAKANVNVGKAVLEQAKATLFSAETNLGYTTIVSPVEGTIIARRVNVGQTVVSSLNAPSLFLIARDLRRLEVWVQVNEADIGQVRVGMPVHFTVDAYRDEQFRGEVRQIRLEAKVTNNVITYPVVVTTNNDNLKLLPYLSANVQFEVDERKEVLQVPNAALRFRPRPEVIDPAAAAAAPPSPAGAADNHRRVWVRHGNFVRPIDIEIGVTDGAFSEVVGGDLAEGTAVVLGEQSPDVVENEGTNPFAFRRPTGTKQPKKK
jgi:HlyD family secretion protein